VRGDINCDHTLGVQAALSTIRWNYVWRPNILPPWCPGIGTYGVPVRGDLNCDGEINAADALVSVRFAAGLPSPLPSGCPPFNS
jgi:hypothetical protein